MARDKGGDTSRYDTISEDFRDICYACRINDLEKVKLIMAKGVNVNQVDEWDNSPLILASLCGHERIVRYLLENGAVCERNTWEGERCIYGALTDSIKKLLIRFNVSKKVNANQSFVSYISFLHFKSTSLSKVKTVDLSFKTRDGHFYAHRFLLSVWSDYFGVRLMSSNGKWLSKHEILVSDQYSYDSFDYLLKLLYLNTSVSNIFDENIIELTKEYELEELNHLLKTLINDRSKDEVNKLVTRFQDKLYELLMEKMEVFTHENILRKKKEIPLDIEEEAEDDDLDNIEVYKDSLSNEKKLDFLLNSSVPDVILAMKNENNTLIYYPVHRAILCRCLYYKTMFESSIGEPDRSDDEDSDNENEQDGSLFDWPQLLKEPSRLPVTALTFTSSVEATEIILKYLYYDTAIVNIDIAMEVLLLADALLIDKMKWAASIELTKSLDYQITGYSIYEILRAGWLTNTTRIEQYAAKIFANNLKEFIKTEEFKDVVIESASRIQNRHETDTIELIDDIRYYLTYHKYGYDFSEDPNLGYDVLGLKSNEETVNASNNAEDELTRRYREYLTDLTLIDELLETLKLNA